MTDFEDVLESAFITNEQAKLLVRRGEHLLKMSKDCLADTERELSYLRRIKLEAEENDRRLSIG